MTRLHVDPNARHPLYQGALLLAQVHPGVQFLTLDTSGGNFTLTTLASEWRAEVIPIVSTIGVPLASVIHLRADDIDKNVVDLHEKGIHPPVEANDSWNMGSLSVLADRDNILTFYPWLVKEGFTRAANELEDTFFEFFVDPEIFWSQLMKSGG